MNADPAPQQMTAVVKFLRACKKMAIWNVNHDWARLVRMSGIKAASCYYVIHLEKNEVQAGTEFWRGLMLNDRSQPKESQNMHHKRLLEFIASGRCSIHSPVRYLSVRLVMCVYDWRKQIRPLTPPQA